MKIKLGARWPDYWPETAIDRGTIRAFVQAVEDLGFDHITAFDHPMSMTPETAGHDWGWSSGRIWHESLTLMSFMAGLTDKLGFLTAAYVLPLRSPILVAKQVASLENFTDGQFRFGVAVGSNEVEYKALGEPHEHRGTRLEEQIEVLRELWQNETTSFHGRWYDFPEIGLSSTLVKGPVEIWMGMSGVGVTPPPWVLRRAGRLADGILPTFAPDEAARAHLDRISEAARTAGRDPQSIGIEPAILLRRGESHNWHTSTPKSDDELASEITAWANLGATHMEVKTRSCGLRGLDEHLSHIERFKRIADSVL